MFFGCSAVLLWLHQTDNPLRYSALTLIVCGREWILISTFLHYFHFNHLYPHSYILWGAFKKTLSFVSKFPEVARYIVLQYQQ